MPNKIWVVQGKVCNTKEEFIAARAARQEAWRKSQRRDPVTWRKIILKGLRERAKKKGLPFDLKAEDIELVTHCPILGIELQFGCPRNTLNGPSVDRRKPHLGYIKGNVFILSWKANALKKDCTDPAVFRAIADYLEKTQ